MEGEGKEAIVTNTGSSPGYIVPIAWNSPEEEVRGIGDQRAFCAPRKRYNTRTAGISSWWVGADVTAF